jgi:hypothetical protein
MGTVLLVRVDQENRPHGILVKVNGIRSGL